jgi:mono/diheme cytochrome c family protein
MGFKLSAAHRKDRRHRGTDPISPKLICFGPKTVSGNREMTYWSKIAVIGIVVIAGAVAAVRWFSPKSVSPTEPLAVLAPAELSPKAQAGKIAFDANCAQCHGANAAGTDRGPPFVHVIYNPGHHPDELFALAAKIGVRHHHWNFGDMPPQSQVSEQQLAEIVAYVRAMQEANGIFYQPHRM